MFQTDWKEGNIIKTLVETIREKHVVSIIGNAKNAGKTTVLNALIFAKQSEIIAITSIGLDGEELDQITRLPKPRIQVYPGMIIATAEATLSAATAQSETIARTGLNTPLGEVLLQRVVTEGHMLIGGPSQVAQMRSLILQLDALGVRQIFIDGAFARETFARVSDASVLCIGANHSPDLETVVRHAAATIRKFSIPLASENYRTLEMNQSIFAIDHQNIPTVFSYDSLLDIDQSFFEGIRSDHKALFVPKAIGDTFANEWLKRRKDFLIPWIIDNPTQLVVSDKTLERIFAFGQPIYCLHPANIVAICYNPYAPSGHTFDDLTFLKRLRSITTYPLFNVLSKRGANHE